HVVVRDFQITADVVRHCARGVYRAVVWMPLPIRTSGSIYARVILVTSCLPRCLACSALAPSAADAGFCERAAIDGPFRIGNLGGEVQRGDDDAFVVWITLQMLAE